MNKDKWNEVVRKTKWASGKKKLNKKELGELLTNAVTLEKFMEGNKSDFGNISRKEVFRKTADKMGKE